MEARSMENKVNLHEHLIWEILLRLPTKSLVRLKCVSKSWFSMISDDNFAKLHFELTASHTLKLVFSKSVSIVDSSKAAKIRYIDSEGSIDEFHSVNNLVSPFPSPVLEALCVTILGVCRGFILLGYVPNKFRICEYGLPKNMLVWNPSTGIHRTLSYSEIVGSTVARLPWRSTHFSYSFEYDPLTDDYFVIIACYDKGFRRVDRFELFSMRTNSWNQFDATHLPCTKHWEWDQHNFLFVNRAIHWLAIDKYADGESVKAIIAFDLIEGNCSEIPMPHDGFVYNFNLKLEVIGGCLCLLYSPKQLGFAELWIMKEYKVKSSWTKCNYVPPHAIPLPDFNFSPIYFTKSGQIVGSVNCCMALAKLDDKGKVLQRVCFRMLDENLHTLKIYTESLLSLPGPN